MDIFRFCTLDATVLKTSSSFFCAFICCVLRLIGIPGYLFWSDFNRPYAACWKEMVLVVDDMMICVCKKWSVPSTLKNVFLPCKNWSNNIILRVNLYIINFLHVGPNFSVSNWCVNYCLYAWWSQWCFVEIIYHIELLVCWSYWICEKCPQHVQCVVEFSSKEHQNITGKSSLVSHSTATKQSLKVWISLSAAFNRLLCGSTSCYWLFYFDVMYYMRLFDDSLYTMFRMDLYPPSVK